MMSMQVIEKGKYLMNVIMKGNWDIDSNETDQFEPKKI